MPYVKGSGWDAATEQLAEGFATGTRVGLAKQELAQRKAWQEQQAKVQAAAQKIQADQEARALLAEQRHKAESEAQIAATQASTAINQKKLEEHNEAEARALGMSKADVKHHRNISQQIMQLHPEMGEEVKTLWQVAMTMDDPKARAIWLNENAAPLVEEATQLSHQKSAAKVMEALDRGRVGPGTVRSAAFDAKMQDFQMRLPTMAPQDIDKELSDLWIEGKSIDAEATSLANGGAYLRGLLDPNLVKPGSKEEKSLLTLIGLAETGHPDVDVGKAEKTIKETLEKLANPQAAQENPRMKGMLQILKEIPAVDDLGAPIPMEKRLDEAEAIYARISGEAPKQAQPKVIATQAEAEARIAELVASGVPHAQAVAQAMQEAGGAAAEPESDSEMRAPTSTSTKFLTKPIDTMDKAGLDEFKRKVDAGEASRKLKSKPKASANKRGDGIKNR